MRFPRLASLRGLIVLGTLLLAIPMLIALGNSMVQTRALSKRSAALIAHTAETTRAGDELERAANALERAAKLRAVDPAYDDLLADNVSRTLDAVDAVIAIGGREIADDCARIRAQIKDLNEADQAASARHAKVGDPALSAAIGKLADLTDLINRINQRLAQRTAAALEEIQASTAQTESRLFKELSVLLPMTILVVIGFLSALSRPLRRIDAAIDALGRGRYESPIAIRGPTDLVKLGEQLEWLRLRLIEVAEAKNRFLRHVSHELKTPLASIREGTELLLEGAVGTLQPEQREVVGILRDNGIHLQRHIENLLSYSAWEAKTVGLDLEEFPIRDLVRGVIEAHRMTILAHRLRLSIEVGDFTVTADRAKLRLILDNLVSNAVKYTPHDGSITVKATSDGSGLIMEVIDTGPGIAPEDRPRLFEAFYTGRSQAMGPLRGTGIGLSVVLEFTEAHGGRIDLVDKEGTGAHFRLLLPAYPRAVRRTTIADHE